MSLIGDKQLGTSEQGEEILERIREVTRLDFAVICKIAIGLSLLEPSNLDLDLEYDSQGKNMRGSSIFGNDDYLYHALCSLIHQRKLSPEEFFSANSLGRRYLESGLRLMESLLKTAHNDKLLFLNALVSKIPIDAQVISKKQKNQLNIVIGKQSLTRQEVRLELNNTDLHPNPHLAVMGKSGVGKTQFLFHILSEIRSISHEKTNVIFLDYKGDVSTNTHFVEQGKFEVFSLPKQNLPINPFQLNSYENSEIRISAREKTQSFALIAPKGFGAVQQNTLTELIITAYENRKSASKKFPDFKELFQIAQQSYESENKKPDTLYTILKDLSAYDLFWRHNSETAPFESILQHSFIVDLSKLPMLKELVSYLVIGQLYKEITALPDSAMNGKYREIRTILVIDEAHNYLGHKNSFLEKIIREGRSKGVAVFLATQSPKDFKNVKQDLKEFLEFLYLFQCDDLDSSSVRSLLRVDNKRAKRLATQISQFKSFTCISRNGSNPFATFDTVRFYESHSR